uniref:Ovule protein n=1 Tax=Strongyloides venezuelensis TaxID=75913 RepID=A0A0K0F289_STRVS
MFQHASSLADDLATLIKGSHHNIKTEKESPTNWIRTSDLRISATEFTVLRSTNCTEKVKYKNFAHKIEKSTNFVKCRIFTHMEKC